MNTSISHYIAPGQQYFIISARRGSFADGKKLKNRPRFL